MRKWLVILSLMGHAILGSDAVPVSQKDLVERYREYNGRRVIVSGEVVSDSEMTLMYLPGTTGNPTAKEGILVTPSEKESKKPNQLTKRLTKDLNKSSRPTAELEGRFEGADDRRWGRQACCRCRLQDEGVIISLK